MRWWQCVHGGVNAPLPSSSNAAILAVVDLTLCGVGPEQELHLLAEVLRVSEPLAGNCGTLPDPPTYRVPLALCVSHSPYPICHLFVDLNGSH